MRTLSSYWFDRGLRVYQAFPYHWLIEPTENEIKDLFRQNKAIGIRYSTPISASSGKPSYHVVCEKPLFGLESFPKKVRQDIKHGLNYSSIERIPISRLGTEGWELRLETLKRQGREKAENNEWWLRLCRIAEGLPGFEAWGALHEGKLVSSLLCVSSEDCYSMLYQQSSSLHLKHGINNALLYIAIKNALEYEGISQVFITLQSLDAPASVDEFKFRMGFTAKPVKQRVVFHPVIAPLFNPLSYRLIKKLSTWKPQNPSLSKVEGMVRFYLEGKNHKSDIQSIV